jgi:hypothetical protein
MFLFVTDRQFFATFGSSAFQNQAAVFAAHPGSKAVLVGTFLFTGLKGTFHR